MRNHGHLKWNYPGILSSGLPYRNKVTSIAPITLRSLRIDSPHPRCPAPASANSRSAVRVLEHPEMLLGYSIACINHQESTFGSQIPTAWNKPSYLKGIDCVFLFWFTHRNIPVLGVAVVCHRILRVLLGNVIYPFDPHFRCFNLHAGWTPIISHDWWVVYYLSFLNYHHWIQKNNLHRKPWVVPCFSHQIDFKNRVSCKLSHPIPSKKLAKPPVISGSPWPHGRLASVLLQLQPELQPPRRPRGPEGFHGGSRRARRVIVLECENIWKWSNYSAYQWDFQDPKLEVPTIYKAYVRPM